MTYLLRYLTVCLVLSIAAFAAVEHSRADFSGALNGVTTCNKVLNISQTGTTDVHTFTGIGIICSGLIITATAQSVGLDEGTGTTCETNGTALIGVSSTASATAVVPLGTNGGFTFGPLRMQTAADHLCVVQSGGAQLGGYITYADTGT